MTAAKEKMMASEALELCVSELQAPKAKGSADPRRNPFIKAYKFLDPETRKKVSKQAATTLLKQFEANERIDTTLYLLCLAFTNERDWNAVQQLLATAVSLTGEASFFREIALALLEIADIELSDRSTKLPLAETALVILTEFGLMLANQQGKSALDLKGTAGVVEYISTSLLARSNVNSTAMRITLVHFLSSCNLGRQSTQQLNRVISRFGHSLLEELLRAFFDDKKKMHAAFYFLVEHLSAFFAASPALAVMCHDVLKHYMLKYPAEFPSFLASYSEVAPRDKETLVLATKHISLLYRAAIDVYQRPLSEAIGRVLLKHLALFKEMSTNLLHEQIESVYSVLNAGQPLRGPRGMLVQDLIVSLQALDGDARAAQKVVSLSRAKKGKDSQIRMAKVGERPTPLESMLQLAS